jgi:PAS domain S-box-containing protein
MRLCEFMRAQPDAITARWLERVQALEPAKRLPPLALLAQMPQLIDRLTRVMTARAHGRTATLTPLALEHARTRLAQGFSTGAMVEEYARLRQVIVELWSEQQGDVLSVTEASRLAIALDEAIAGALRLAGERRDLAQQLELAVEVTGVGTFAWPVGSERIEWSAEARAIFGVGAEVEITPRFVGERAFAEDRPRLQAALEKAMSPEGNGSFECDSRFRRLDDGEERWVVLRGRVFFDKGKPVRMLGTMLDITDRKRESLRLRFFSDATALLASTLEAGEIFNRITRLVVPEWCDWSAVDLVMPGGAIERVAVTHSDQSKAEVVKDVARRFPPAEDQQTGSRKVIHSGQPELMSHVSGELMERLARTDTHLSLMRAMGMESYVCVPLIAHGRVLGAFSIVSTQPGRRFGPADLELAQNLAQRAALNLENARLYQASKDAAKQREQMLAIVSHDLRNPLNAIAVAGSLLERRAKQLPGEERAVRHAEIVERSARRMEELIDHLLDVASIQAGRLKIAPKPELSSSVLDEVLELEAAIASEHGIALSVDDRSPDGTVLQADRARLLEVFENLIGNAIKFCRSGDSVSISARQGDGCVVFAVADTGPGIPGEVREHIFEPYWQATHDARGTGLGLFISQGIIEAQGGSIWVESNDGEGTTFRFTVPLADAAHDEPRPSIH